MKKCAKCLKNKVNYSKAFDRSICYNCKATYTREDIFIDYDHNNNIIVGNLEITNNYTKENYDNIITKILQQRNKNDLGSELGLWFKNLDYDTKIELFHYAKTTKNKR